MLSLVAPIPSRQLGENEDVLAIRDSKGIFTTNEKCIDIFLSNKKDDFIRISPFILKKILSDWDKSDNGFTGVDKLNDVNQQFAV